MKYIQTSVKLLRLGGMLTLEDEEKGVVLWLPAGSHKGQDMLDILLS